jgi:hypothetical protein
MTPPTGAETGLIKTVISALLKPFEIVTTPIAERVAGWLKRKPRLYVHFHPLTAVWCLANQNKQPVMQVVFTADFTHDGNREALVIVNAYPKKSQSWYPFEKFDICPGRLIENRTTVFAYPVVGEKGKDWNGRMVFVDQFGRKYTSQKNTFKWAGPAR